MSWNDQNTEQLKTMWADGLSCSQIARALGTGITRNAVIGKVARLGLSRTTGWQRRTYPLTPKERVVRVCRPAAVSLPPPPADEPAPLLEPDVFAANGQCKWIHGDTIQPGWRMCGHPAHKPGSPWCAFHQGRAYDKPKTKAAADKRAAREADAAQTRIARRIGLG